MGTPLKGRPIQVVLAIDHAFKLDEPALREILLGPRVKNRKVVVLSVAGAYRKGKSFLLDFFLRYLNDPNDPNWLGDVDSPLEGFTWRGGSERDTTGILMWSEPFIIKRGQEEVAVLLMDTQGSFDSRSTVNECATVFALSTMLSSVQVFNLSMNIQEDDLQHLQLFTEYGRLANGINNSLNPFQSLQFLVMDWYHLNDAQYGEEGGKKILEKRLQIHVDQQPELQQLREHIRSCFQRIGCYLMPSPGSKVATSGKSDGRLKDMDPEFQEHLKSYIELLLDQENLSVKEVNGREITGQELLEYFKAYMSTFQSNVLPELQSILIATAQGNNLAAVATARDVYYTEMESICAPDKPWLKPDLLEIEHWRSVEMALDLFTKTPKMGGFDFSKPHADNLQQQIEKLHSYFIKLNDSKPHRMVSDKMFFSAVIAALVTSLVPLFVLTPLGAAGVVATASAAVFTWALPKTARSLKYVSSLGRKVHSWFWKRNAAEKNNVDSDIDIKNNVDSDTDVKNNVDSDTDVKNNVDSDTDVKNNMDSDIDVKNNVDRLLLTEKMRNVEMAVLDAFTKAPKMGGVEFSKQQSEMQELELQELYKNYIKHKPHNTLLDMITQTVIPGVVAVSAVALLSAAIAFSYAMA